MASPVDSAQQGTNITTASTSHAVNVGSPVAGTLLVVWARFAAAPGTVTFTGYTSIASDASDASDDTSQVFYRWADGAEGATDTCAPTNSVKAAYICWEITGAENPATQAPEISTVAVGTTSANTCNPDVVTPTGGSKDYLFLALGAQDGEVGSYTAAPASYANLATANSGTGGQPATNCYMGGASRQLTAASDNPGVFTHGAATTGWTAYTVAIHPTSLVTETPTPGGGIAGGVAAVAKADAAQGGVPAAAGTTPSPRAPVTAAGAVGSGFAATSSVSSSSGGGVAGGQGPSALVALVSGGALAGGVAPTESSGTTETPTPGGAVAGGTAPIVYTILTAQGAVAVGVSPSAIVVVATGGATAGGVAPFDPLEIIATRNFDMPSPDQVAFDPPVPIGQVG